jgi:hypothetical protein
LVLDIALGMPSPVLIADQSCPNERQSGSCAAVGWSMQKLLVTDGGPIKADFPPVVA